jgi:hypothetical protein
MDPIMMGCGKTAKKNKKRRVVRLRIKKNKLRIADRKFKIKPPESNKEFKTLFLELMKELKAIRKTKPSKSNFRYGQVLNKQQKEINKLNPKDKNDLPDFDKINEELIQSTIKYNPEIQRQDLDDLLAKSKTPATFINDVVNYMNEFRMNQKAADEAAVNKQLSALKAQEDKAALELDALRQDYQQQILAEKERVDDLYVKQEEAEKDFEAKKRTLAAQLQDAKDEFDRHRNDADITKQQLAKERKNLEKLVENFQEERKRLDVEMIKIRRATNDSEDKFKEKIESLEKERINREQALILQRNKAEADLAAKIKAEEDKAKAEEEAYEAEQERKQNRARELADKAKARAESKMSKDALANKRRAEALRLAGYDIPSGSLQLPYDSKEYEKLLDKAEAEQANQRMIDEAAEVAPKDSEGSEAVIDTDDDIIDLEDQAEIDRAFAASGEGLNPNDEGQSEDELDKYGKREPGYIGSCCINEIINYKDDLLEPDFKYNHLIVNTLPRSMAGKKTGHWCCLTVENDLDKGRFTVHWFDPLSDPMPIRAMEQLKEIVEDQPVMYEMKTNLINSQDNDSTLCGYHCLHLIKQLNNGLSWKKATHFDESEITEPIDYDNI